MKSFQNLIGRSHGLKILITSSLWIWILDLILSLFSKFSLIIKILPKRKKYIFLHQSIDFFFVNLISFLKNKKIWMKEWWWIGGCSKAIASKLRSQSHPWKNPSGVRLDLTTRMSRAMWLHTWEAEFRAWGPTHVKILSRTICWLGFVATMVRDATDQIPWQERTTVGIRGLLGHAYATEPLN